MLEVGWPDPALVAARIESPRSCAARSATTSSDVSFVSPIVVMVGSSPQDGGPCTHHNHMTTRFGGHPPARPASYSVSVPLKNVSRHGSGEARGGVRAVHAGRRHHRRDD